LENSRGIFPTLGKTGKKISNDWKNSREIFQSLETAGA
jgi:hypothetical protein